MWVAEVWVECWWWVDRELLMLWVGDEQDFVADVEVGLASLPEGNAEVAAGDVRSAVVGSVGEQDSVVGAADSESGVGLPVECVEDCSVVDASGGADGAHAVGDVRVRGCGGWSWRGADGLDEFVQGCLWWDDRCDQHEGHHPPAVPKCSGWEYSTSVWAKGLPPRRGHSTARPRCDQPHRRVRERCRVNRLRILCAL